MTCNKNKVKKEKKRKEKVKVKEIQEISQDSSTGQNVNFMY